MKVIAKLISAAGCQGSDYPGRKAMTGKDIMIPDLGAGYMSVFLS